MFSVFASRTREIAENDRSVHVLAAKHKKKKKGFSFTPCFVMNYHRAGKRAGIQ